MPYIPNRDKQDNKLNKEYKSKALVFCYTMLYYSTTCIYHEIITKSFTRPTLIILCRLQFMIASYYSDKSIQLIIIF